MRRRDYLSLNPTLDYMAIPTSSIPTPKCLRGLTETEAKNLTSLFKQDSSHLRQFSSKLYFGETRGFVKIIADAATIASRRPYHWLSRL